MIIDARGSTTEQNLDLQRDALKRSRCEKIIEEMASGGKVQRTGLERMHDTLRDGGVVADRLDAAFLREMSSRFEVGFISLLTNYIRASEHALPLARAYSTKRAKPTSWVSPRSTAFARSS